MNRSWLRHLLLITTIAALLGVPNATQAAGSRCFAETGYCIAGRIREFWEQNGGLPVFGFPITPQQTETIEGRAVQVQWFERNRLELHPENRRPYDVLLGRLGAARLGAQSIARATAEDGCRFFAETGQSVCGDILAAWSANGLELDGRPGKSAGESLALFGLPLSGLHAETLGDGRQYMVQWFERARFELHPENGPAARVLFGLLGREAGPVAHAAPQAAASPPVRMVISAWSRSGPTAAARRLCPTTTSAGSTRARCRRKAKISCSGATCCAFATRPTSRRRSPGSKSCAQARGCCCMTAPGTRTPTW
jgi:hypothetical protein